MCIWPQTACTSPNPAESQTKQTRAGNGPFPILDGQGDMVKWIPEINSMLVGHTTRSTGFSNIIYERKGSIHGNESFVSKYLEEFPNAFLDYRKRILVENTDGIRVIYFRDDFADEERYVRLYNYILSGHSSRSYYLKGKAIWLRNNDLRQFYRFFRSLSKQNQKSVLEEYGQDFSFDEDDYFYRTLFMGEPHNAIFGEWLVESEYRTFNDVLKQNEEWLRYVNHTYNDLYTIYFSDKDTVFDLAETVRKAIRLLSEGSKDHSGGSNTIHTRKDLFQDYPFLFDKDPDRFFEELGESIPFADELKSKLMEKRESFSDCLFRLMREKGIESQSKLTAKKGQLGISSAVMSKWINNRDPNRTPSKETVYAIIMAAKLDMKDAVALMKSANLEFGYTPVDIIVRMFIDNQMYDLGKLDRVVFEVTHKTLLNNRFLDSDE